MGILDEGAHIDHGPGTAMWETRPKEDVRTLVLCSSLASSPRDHGELRVARVTKRAGHSERVRQYFRSV